MPVRGVTLEEVEETLIRGISVPARGTRQAKELVFLYGRAWSGRMYQQKKVRVIYIEEEELVVITVLAYYGQWEPL
jgi:hypothetical protein